MAWKLLCPFGTKKWKQERLERKKTTGELTDSTDWNDTMGENVLSLELSGSTEVFTGWNHFYLNVIQQNDPNRPENL
jgi:hypothetical protein